MPLPKLQGSVWIDGNNFRFVDGSGNEWVWTGVFVSNVSGLVPGCFWLDGSDLFYVNQGGNQIYKITGPILANEPIAMSGSVWIDTQDNRLRWIDTSKNYRGAHADVSHGDGVSHTDTAHSDQGHVDSHTDSHLDSSHGDAPHSDSHSDSHSDTPHDDVAHSDAHYDGSTHSDGGMYHEDFSFPSGHSDYWTPGGGTHNDHQDIHYDTHTDTSHNDSHADTPHGDSSHSDGPHSDHTDQVHGDAAHGDNPHVDHSDSSGITSHADNPTLVGP